MFALFREIPYEGSDLIGVYSSLGRAIEEAQFFIARLIEEDGGFHGVCEVRPLQIDERFVVGFLEAPLWRSV